MTSNALQLQGHEPSQWRRWHATAIPSRIYPFSSDQGSQTGLGSTSTRLSDRPGTLSAVAFGLLFLCKAHGKLVELPSCKANMHPLQWLLHVNTSATFNTADFELVKPPFIAIVINKHASNRACRWLAKALKSGNRCHLYFAFLGE